MIVRGYYISLIFSLLCFISFHSEAAELSPYLKLVTAEEKPLTSAQAAANVVISLDADMQAIYDNNLNTFEENLLKKHPIILALFSNEGGDFYLYRPGHAVLKAEPVPQVYVITKSVAHSVMATYQLLIRDSFNAQDNHAWIAPVKMFLTANESALESIDKLDASSEQKNTLKNVIDRNIKFINKCLDDGSYTLSDIETYAQKQKEDLMILIGYATEAQVDHWVSVLSDWEKMLGPQWEDAYAVSNTLYVTRRRNILFTILAQFMGKDAINDRLLLVETSSFTITPEQILSELTRIISDRAIGEIFFNNDMQMDVELLGEGARTQLKKDASKFPHPLLLPPEEPLTTHKFPWE